MWSMFEIIQKLAQAPPTGFYSPIAPLRECMQLLKLWKNIMCLAFIKLYVKIAKPSVQEKKGMEKLTI